ncbi:MAG: ABC transporter ATP-binding protein [Pseudomonadota bacterium]
MKFAERLIDPYTPSAGPPPRTLWGYGRWAFRGAERATLILTALSMLAGLAEAAAAVIVGYVVDLAARSQDPAGFFAEHAWPLALTALFFLVLRPTLMSLTSAITSRCFGTSLYPMGVLRIHGHVLGQPLKFFEDDFAGRLSQKEIQATYALVEIVTETLHAVVFGVATVIGALVMLQGVGGGLALVLVAWFIAYLALVAYFLPRIRARARARADAKSVIAGQLVDSLGHMATVKLFAHAGREAGAAEAAVRAYRDKALAFGYMTWLFRTWLSILSGALPVAMIGLALWLWQVGAASPGVIAVAGLISTRLAQMSGWISFTALGIFSNVGVLEDGIQTLTPPHTLTDRPDAKDPPPLTGAIRYENASFRYGRETGGIGGITLDIAPGERVALVGASGAGKSTMVALLTRLYDIEAGRITIDGHHIAALTQDGLRRQIAVVTQDAAMFNRSALDNILYGRPDAGREAAIAAARQAEAHDFLTEIEDPRGRTGYDAHLGERGVKLSGGQRQRIALARAILKDAPILVLDEATSALDSESEAAIQTALTRLMQGKTVIAIAHRLSTISHMDRIVVMEDGQIIEQGPHDALLAKGGRYAGFWHRQSGGLIGAHAAE